MYSAGDSSCRSSAGFQKSTWDDDAFQQMNPCIALAGRTNAEDDDLADELANDLADVLEITDCEVSFFCML
jgi:hypothetical protein